MWNQEAYKSRALELQDHLDALPARHPARKELKDEFRFIVRQIRDSHWKAWHLS